MSTLLTLRAPLPELALAEGDVETEIQILKYGKFHHGKFGAFDVDTRLADQMLGNFDRERAGGHELFVTIGHPDDLDGAPAAGWITALRKAADGVYAKVRLLAETAARIRKGEFKFFSPTFTPEGRDEQGRSIGARLLSGAITNFPFLKGMQPFELSAVPAGKDTDMDESTVKTLVAEATGPIEVKLSEATATIKTLSEQLATLTETATKAAEESQVKLSEKDAKIVSLTERLAGLERGVVATQVREIVALAEKAGKLTPAQKDKFFPGLEKDAVAAFEASPFKSIKSLSEWVASAAPVVDLSGRISTPGSSEPTDPHELSDSEIKRLGYQDRAEFDRYAAMGVGGDPRKGRE